MTRLKQVLVLLLVLFWFSMLGVQMFAEFLDIESLKFVAGKTEAARAFTLRTRFNCFLITLLSLYFFVIKLGKPKNTLEEKKEELQ